MRRALSDGGNGDLTARIIPAAGHGLTSIQTYQGKPFRRAINREFLETLASWVKQTTGR
jgi:hypothetical protein